MYPELNFEISNKTVDWETNISSQAKELLYD